VLPLAAQVSDHYLHTGGELSSSSCAFHPGERQTRTGPAVQILDHDAVEANLPSCGWSAAVIGREFSPHGPDAVRWTTRSLKVVHLHASEAAVSHDRPPDASPRLASVTVGRRSAAPSGDVNLPAAAACWASQ
jgi:hypothetical protein